MKYLLVLISVFMFSNCSRTNYIYNSKIGENEVTIELIPSSVQYSSDDTLYFSFNLINKTDKDLLFYHMQSIYAQTIYFQIDSLPSIAHPRNYLQIINNENKLPKYMKWNLEHFPLKYQPGYELYSYVMLPALSSKTLDGAVYIGNIYLEKGKYRLALEYFSFKNKYFTKHLKKEKRKKKELKDYELFLGIIHSDTCSFTLPETIEPAEKFRKKHKIKNDSQ